jgi:hypothetical protein
MRAESDSSEDASRGKVMPSQPLLLLSLLLSGAIIYMLSETGRIFRAPARSSLGKGQREHCLVRPLGRARLSLVENPVYLPTPGRG